MTKYELMTILRPDMEKAEVDNFMGFISEKIKDAAGEVVEASNWGKKIMAYEIRGYSQGYYTLIIFNGTELLEDKVKALLDDNPDIIRYMLIHDNKTIFN